MKPYTYSSQEPGQKQLKTGSLSWICVPSMFSSLSCYDSPALKCRFPAPLLLPCLNIPDIRMHLAMNSMSPSITNFSFFLLDSENDGKFESLKCGVESVSRLQTACVDHSVLEDPSGGLGASDHWWFSLEVICVLQAFFCLHLLFTSSSLLAYL